MKEYQPVRHAIDASQRIKEKEYWLGQLSGGLLRSFFPYDYTANDALEARQTATLNFRISAEIFAKVSQLSNNSTVRLHIILMAVLVGLLDKYTANKDIIIGAPIKKQEVEGEFINTVLILRNQLKEDMTFKDMLLQLSRTTAEAHEHINYPMETLLYQLDIPYPGLHDDFPLFDAALLLTEIHDKKYLQHLNLNMILSFSRKDQCIEGEVEYNASRYDKSTIEAVVFHYNRYLEAVLADINIKLPGIDILGETEKRQLLFDFNDTEAGYPADKTIQQLFAEQVEKAPDRVALIGSTGSTVETVRATSLPIAQTSLPITQTHLQVTYRQLNGQSDGVAGVLIEKGVLADNIVGIMVEPSVEMIIGILGILKAGGAYLPIDPGYPEARKQYMLKDSNALVLVNEKFFGGAGGAVLQKSPPVNANLAYIIYTSGTTGNPKGVMVTHKNVTRLMVNDRFLFDFSHADVWTLFHSYCFDFSVWEMYGALLYGGKLVIISTAVKRDPGAYLEVLKQRQVTILNQTPSGFSNLIDKELGDREKRLRLKTIIFGGEALNPKILEKWKKKYPQTRYINMYGITETTVHVTYKEITDTEITMNSGNIGKPIPTLCIYIMNSAGQLFPPGAPGEICVGGDGVARGYLNRPELTAEKFILPSATRDLFVKRSLDPQKLLINHHSPLTTHPSPLYKTGDLARLTRNGQLEYLGRIDNQVKIRGHRIELGELENHILKFTPVKDATVMVREDINGEKQLAAYIVPQPDHCFPIFQLLKLERQGLLKNKSYYDLPNQMPAFFLNRAETDFMYREIFENRSYLQDGIILEDDACVFDIGANIGIFSLFANKECKNAQIYAFEPLPPIFEVLTLNTTIYKGNFHLFPYGIAKDDGESVFTYYPNATVLSSRFADRAQEIKNVEAFMLNQSSADPDRQTVEISGEQLGELLENRLTGNQFTCPVKTLSRVMEENKIEKIDLLKIDVEKGELDVLNGIAQDDWPRIRQIVIEVHNVDGRLAVIVEMLKKRGYEVTFQQDEQLQTTDLYNLYARLKTAQPAREKNGPGNAVNKTAWNSSSRLIDDLRNDLKRKLPAYMIPGFFILLDQLPVSPNGKIDRKALPEPRESISAIPAAPTTDIEKKIADVWIDILKRDRIGINDSFFDVGGTSITIIPVNTRLRELFNRDIPVVKMFEYPTIRSFANYLEQSMSRDGEFFDHMKNVDLHLDQSLDMLSQTMEILAEG